MMNWKKVVLWSFFPVFTLAIGNFCLAQSKIVWKMHDLNRPQPKVITPPQQYLPVPPPSDAIVLFSGGNLDQWEGTDGKPTKWIAKDDYFECVEGSGFIRTKQSFGDIQLHLEWAAPLLVQGNSQGRGNSGVYLMGKYELQVLDSYNNPTYPDGQAAAIYGQYPPLVNVSRPPGEWQSYDIIFHRPHFDNIGRVIKPASMTAFHNGVLVQDNKTIWGEVIWFTLVGYHHHADKLPLSLQDHGNPVRYRNIWVRELLEDAEPKPEYAPVVALSETELQKYVGDFECRDKGKDEKAYFKLDNGMLQVTILGNNTVELQAHSKTHFSAKVAAMDFIFKLDSDGKPESFELIFDGSKNRYDIIK